MGRQALTRREKVWAGALLISVGLNIALMLRDGEYGWIGLAPMVAGFALLMGK